MFHAKFDKMLHLGDTYIFENPVTLILPWKVIQGQMSWDRLIVPISSAPDGLAVWGVVVSTHWWLLVDHCVLRNWDRILVKAVKGLISRVGMVSICPLLWQRDVKLQQTKLPISWCVFLINYGQNMLSLWNISRWKPNDLDLPFQFHQRSNVIR